MKKPNPYNKVRSKATGKSWIHSFRSTQNKTREILFAFILLVLFIPLVEYKSKMVTMKPLGGSFELAKDTTCTLEGWFDGKYQRNQTNYYNDNFGFHNFFIRLHNQLDFTLFKKANSDNLNVGKENYIFWASQIKAYYGEDYIGADSIKNRLRKLKFIQDTLSKLGKMCMIVLAPGKAAFYPEYIPERFKTSRGPTNYQYYSKYAKELSINCLDLTSLFLSIKAKATYPLFPQYGVHLSYNGNVDAGEILLGMVESLGKIKITPLTYVNLESTEEAGTDLDGENNLNLLFSLKKRRVQYMQGYVPKDSKILAIPSFLVIGDSYAKMMFSKSGISNVISARSHFWYFGKKMYSRSDPTFAKTVDVGPESAKTAVLSHDVIVIMETDINLPNFSYGIIESLYDQFKKG